MAGSGTISANGGGRAAILCCPAEGSKPATIEGVPNSVRVMPIQRRLNHVAVEAAAGARHRSMQHHRVFVLSAERPRPP